MSRIKTGRLLVFCAMSFSSGAALADITEPAKAAIDTLQTSDDPDYQQKIDQILEEERTKAEAANGGERGGGKGTGGRSTSGGHVKGSIDP